MNIKLVSVLRKILKVILWVGLAFVLLFFITALLIQIPSVQTKLSHYATSYISSKTHTSVELGNIGISFPKSVVIKGLFLDDLKKDTLLYAGEAKINLAFLALLNNEVNVNSIALEEVNLNLSNTETDSLFNYNFLLTAFADTTTAKAVKPKTKSKWTFGIDKISLKNIRLLYNDEFGGMNVTATLKNLKINMDLIDLEKSIFKIEEALIESLNANVRINKISKTTTKKPESILPIISANNLQINNTNISYGDAPGKQAVTAAINQLELKNASVDLQKQIVAAGKFFLAKSEIRYNTTETILPPGKPVPVNSSTTAKSDWNVSVKKIELDDNTLSYNIVNKPVIKNLFDASHLDYKHLTLSATDLSYSPLKTGVIVNKFSAVDRNNFAITSFETEFSMDQHSVTAKKLKAGTANSEIDADLNIQYSSLNALKDSLQFMILDLDMKNVSIRNSDILYFNHLLYKQPFFKNVMNISKVSGIVKGPVNKLTGKNLVITTGVNTILKTDFIITGLPEIKTAYYNFPNLHIISGRKDIAMMAGPAIPKNIELPENISLQVVFKGQMKSFGSTLAMASSFGSANLSATVDKNENFSSKINIAGFDVGRLLKNKALYGPVSLTAEAEGHGLDKNTVKADITALVSQVMLKNYNYHNLSLVGTITGQAFEGKINLKDENAAFDLNASVNLNPGLEQYKFLLDLQGADLQKLNFSKDDIRIGLKAEADMTGPVDTINGKAKISNVIIASAGKNYLLDSILITSLNTPGKSELNISSDIVNLKYSGTASPASLPAELNKFLNSYFPFSDSLQSATKSELPDFNFEIQLYNHPVISAILLPQLKGFEPGIIKGSFDKAKNDLNVTASMKNIVYSTYEIKDFAVNINSDMNALNYKVSSSSISTEQLKLENFLIDGKLADQKIIAGISSIDEKKNKKLLIRPQITKDKAHYKITLDPRDFYLMNDRWDIAADNYIKSGKQGLLIHHLFISKTDSKINIGSVHDKFNDDLNIEIKNFRLSDISRIIEKDTSLVKGIIDGNVLLKRVNNTYGIVADAIISNLVVREVPVGNLALKASNPTAEKFDIDLNLSGTDNNLTATGYYVPNGGDNSVHIKTAIQSLSLKTVQAFSMGAITEASGNLTGNFLIEGKSSAPDVTGELVFNDAFITPAALNNKLELKHETVQLKKDGIYFNSFTMLDADNHKAIIDGSVQMNHFKDFIFALHVNTRNFLLFNTTVKDNKEFYGRMIIDSKIDVNGPLTLPVVNAKVKMKEGSNFTFAVPETKLTTNKGEDVVEFNYSNNLNPILTRDEKKVKQKSSLTGFDISSIIEIDKQATLRLLMDPSSSDSLVVKGEAVLSFALDRSGKMTLTGAYNLNDGSYLVTLESLIKRKFDIKSGSTIVWNGDPLDADISINAIYTVRASPIDLVAAQMTGLSETDKNAYKQRYPFLVLLKLRGAILKPEIGFEIQLRPEDKGILGGAVNTKLSMLNEDPSALNKQVFALLVLGRFIQENPLVTEGSNGASTVVRATVGKFLSAQLNKMSSKVLTGVELNFDVQSYDDYSSGQSQGRTQVDIGLKKQLFNDRLTVQVGGVVDVEGAKAKQNSASDITGDATIEYKLTKDGRYRLKGFRHNQYEGAIDGQLVETGAGLIYVRDFNTWKEFLKKPKKRQRSAKNKQK